MNFLEPIIENPQRLHEENLWIKDEFYHFYTQQRRQYCTFMDILDLWLLAPFCTECGIDDPYIYKREPEISSYNWELDILCEVGAETLIKAYKNLKEDPNFSYFCKHCRKELRPWDGDEIHVVSYHLEEHYNIPIEHPNRKKPSRAVRNQIINLYENKCFRCGAEDKPLEIDHIMPQSEGGTASFRNLQPLCKKCNNEKGSTCPNEIQVFSKIYFEQNPSDSYEGLFW